MIKKITFNQAISNFDKYLLQEGKAESTFTAYFSDLELFKKFLKEHLNNKVRYLNDLTKVEIEQYKEYLMSFVKSNVYKKTTVYRKYNTLKTFFRYLHKKYSITNILEDDKWGSNSKAKDFRTCEGEDFLPMVIESEHINGLLKCIKDSTDKNKYRDFAIFTLLTTTGCRRSTVLSLKWEHVDFYRNQIRLTHPKTSNAIVVQLPSLLKSALQLLLQSASLTDGYVFKSRQSTDDATQGLSKSAFNDIIKKWIDASNIQKYYPMTVTAHSFRHAFITNCVREDIATEKIIQYTGHRSADSLEIYKHLVPKDHSQIASLYNLDLDTFSA